MLAIVDCLIKKQESDKNKKQESGKNKTPRVVYDTAHKNIVCGHFDKPHSAKGMCHKCRQRVWALKQKNR